MVQIVNPVPSLILLPGPSVTSVCYKECVFFYLANMSLSATTNVLLYLERINFTNAEIEK